MLKNSTGGNNLSNVEDLKHSIPIANHYGSVSRVCEGGIQSRQHQNNRFEEVGYSLDKIEVVEVTWQDCEKWDTKWLTFSVSWGIYF